MAPVSVSVCHKSVFYQKDEQIKLHSGAEASFNQSLHCHLRKFVYLQNKGTSLWNFFLNYGLGTKSSAIAEGPRDASCQLKSCQLPRNSAELLVRQVLKKSKLWSWRVYSGTMCNKHVHSTMMRSSRLHCPIGVINKPTTVELWISPAYTDDLLWRNFLSPQCRNCSRDPDHAHSGNTHSSQDKDFAWPTRFYKIWSL